VEEGGEQRWVHRHEVVGHLSLVGTCFLQRTRTERTPHAEVAMVEVGLAERPSVAMPSAESAVVLHKVRFVAGRSTRFPYEAPGTTDIALAPVAVQLGGRAGVPEACLH
jgi:hypothetical protein